MKATWSPWHLSVPGHKSAQRLGASGGELDSSRFTSALYVGCRTGLELLGWGEPSGLSDCSPCFTRENLEVRSTGLGAAQLCPAVLFSAFCWNSSWRGLVEGGSSFGFWPRRNPHSWSLVSWSKDTWGWKDSMGDSGCPLQGHTVWPGNSSRMGSLHGALSSAGLARCGLGQILKAQAFQRVGKTLVRQLGVCKGWCETSLFILSS